MDRTQHVAWCKQRALAEMANGDTAAAFASMASDLGKHPETASHSGIELGMMLIMGGQLNSPAKMREFIEGFN